MSDGAPGFDVRNMGAGVRIALTRDGLRKRGYTVHAAFWRHSTGTLNVAVAEDVAADVRHVAGLHGLTVRDSKRHYNAETDDPFIRFTLENIHD